MPYPLPPPILPITTGSWGITIAATAAATTPVFLPRAPAGVTGFQVRIVNEGPNIAFLAFSQSRPTAATLPTATPTNTCDAVLPGEDLILTLRATDMVVSAICRTGGSATLSLYVGAGQ